LKTPFPVAASIAQRPGYGGHANAFLQFLWGLEELGYEPLLIDWLADEMTADEGGRSADRKQGAIEWFLDVVGAAGIDSYCLLLDDGETVGLGRVRTKELIAAAPALLNVMGFLADEDLLGAANARVFIDVDPGFPQLWSELGFAEPFAGHDHFVTVGGNVGRPGCSIPTCGRRWTTIRPPVSLARWPLAEEPLGRCFRTIGSWRGPYGPVEYGGRTLGLRVHEFRRFLDLPARVPAGFEVALDIDPADSADAERLEANGWRLLEPEAVSGSIESYRRFVQSSFAEIGIAKNIYVATESGWFSDRSACFLASGRPVLAQETGFGDDLPVGEGLISFRSLEEAVLGAESFLDDPRRHSGGARALAEEFFDAKTVMSGLLADLGAA
jgi:hypothetical protein